MISPMISPNFKRSNLDTEVLENMNAITPSDELSKALKKEGLVQKDVTVQGKNGTYTRKQWVRASEATSGDQKSAKQEEPKDGKTATDNKKPTISFEKQEGKTGKQSLAEMLSSGTSRVDIMAAAKEQGISWKENDHEGINWMRASMAIQKHMNEGGSAQSQGKMTDKATEQPKQENKQKSSADNSKGKLQVGQTVYSDRYDNGDEQLVVSKLDNKSNKVTIKTKNGEEYEFSQDEVFSSKEEAKTYGRNTIIYDDFPNQNDKSQFGCRNPYRDTPGFKSIVPFFIKGATYDRDFYEVSKGDVYNGFDFDIHKLNDKINKLSHEFGITNGKMYAELNKQDSTKAYLVCETKDGKKSRVLTLTNYKNKASGFINSAAKLDTFVRTCGSTMDGSTSDKLMNAACKDYIATLTPDKQNEANKYMPKRGYSIHWSDVKSILNIKNDISTVKSEKPQSVIGKDYTKLTTEDEADSIEGQAHNMIVGYLKADGKKNPSENDIKGAARSLAEQYTKRDLVYGGENKKLSDHFHKLAGVDRNQTLKDIAQESYGKPDQRSQAIKELLGKEYRVTPGNTVETTADVGGKYLAEVKISPKFGGRWSAEFVYPDGVSRKETYDSVKSVQEASDKFIKDQKSKK